MGLLCTEVKISKFFKKYSENSVMSVLLLLRFAQVTGLCDKAVIDATAKLINFL